MPDGGDDSGPIAPVTGAPAGFDDTLIDTPNCPRCLTRMTVAESRSGEPYWSCTECGQVVLA